MFIPIALCDHKEADTRICVHIKDALEKGCREVYVRTVDTADVIVVIAGKFFELLTDYPGLDLWVGFGMGQQIYMNTLCQNLGEPKCKLKGLPFFHSFTGCDTTSQFHGKGGKVSLGGLEIFSKRY